MVSDIRNAAIKISDREIMSSKVESGRFKGKTLRQSMAEATRKDLADALQYIGMHPSSYYSAEWQISFLYADWVLSGAPGAADLR